MSYRVSVNTGGTFTDVVLVDTGGKLHVAKALTTYARAFDGIRSSLGEPRTRSARPELATNPTFFRCSAAGGTFGRLSAYEPDSLYPVRTSAASSN